MDAESCRAGRLVSTATVTAPAATIAAVTTATAERPVARQLQDGYKAEKPQLYVTHGNDMLATKAGKSIGAAIADVRGSLNPIIHFCFVAIFLKRLWVQL